jgi:hypothetical protein
MNAIVYLRIVLAVLIWIGVLILQGFLMTIARFFERSAQQSTGYQLYLVPIVLTGIGAVRYIIRIPATGRWPDFVGDPIANLVLLAAGVLLIALGNFLYEKMMGGPNREGR